MLELRGSARDYRVVYRWTAIIAVVQAVWAISFIIRSSFVVEGRRYFCLFDDAMISMRYAKNWIAGQGLVWNPGEYVEGYTNFLWTLGLGICHLPRLSPAHTCLLVQILGIAVLWLCLAATARLAKECLLLVPTAIVAVLLVACFYNLSYFTLLGMETGLATALVTFAFAGACASIRVGRLSPLAVGLFAPIVLMRPDALLLAWVIALTLFVKLPGERRRLILHLSAVAGLVLLHTLWRHQYYGQWLPNTYYLKATNWPLAARISPGIINTAHSALQAGVPFLLATLTIMNLRARFTMLLAGFIVAVAYQVYVGGDAWPLSRFLIPAVPGLCVLAALGIERLASAFGHVRWLAGRSGLRAALALTCIGFLNLTQWPHALLIRPPQMTQANQMNVRLVHAIDKVAGPDATAAVGYAGVFPYFSGRTCFDVLGKCDSFIAHLPPNPQLPPRAGHNKTDIAYLIRTHHPDLILHTVCSHPMFFAEYSPAVVMADGQILGLAVRKNDKRLRGVEQSEWKFVSDRISVWAE